MSKIVKIRQKIIDRSYYLSSHVEDEMLDDDLDRNDIELLFLKEGLRKYIQRIYVGRDTVSRVRSKMVEKFM